MQKLREINLELIRKPIGSIITELWFEPFSYLINIENIDFFN